MRQESLKTHERAAPSDCALPAQVQRHALVALTKLMRNAHAHCLSPELQNGRTIAITASVMQHTHISGALDAPQWKAWCCRFLFYAANVDDACVAKVRPPVH